MLRCLRACGTCATRGVPVLAGRDRRPAGARAVPDPRGGAGGRPGRRTCADPGADFADLAILRLELTGQRREIADATRWLDEDNRELLSLWWLEAAGELTRDEIALSLGIGPAARRGAGAADAGPARRGAGGGPRAERGPAAAPDLRPRRPAGTGGRIRCGASGSPGTPATCGECCRRVGVAGRGGPAAGRAWRWCRCRSRCSDAVSRGHAGGAPVARRSPACCSSASRHWLRWGRWSRWRPRPWCTPW